MVGRASLFVALAAFMAGCGSTVIVGGQGGEGGGVATGAVGSTGTGSIGTGSIGTGSSEPDPLAGTSQAHPPTGVWTMSVQYGAVGEPVSPTIPLQVEFRPDGKAYRWICAGAPSDGSYTTECIAPARSECMVGSIAWDGARWKFEFPTLEQQFTVPEMGRIAPDGSGHLLLSYINPTYSGALFQRIGAPATGPDSCVP